MKNLFSIGNSLTLFFIIFLIISIISIFAFEDKKSRDIMDKKAIANLELNEFLIAEINEDNISLLFRGKQALQFNDYEEFFDVELKNIKDFISSPYAKKEGDIIYFNRGVKNTRDGYTLESNRANFFIKKNIFKGYGNFNIKGEFIDIKGDNLYFDGNSIKAENIDAKLDFKHMKKKI